MSSATHDLKVKLSLEPESGDEFKATVTVTTTDTCYHAGDLKPGLPPHMEGLPEVAYLTFYFKHEGDLCGQIVHDVSKSTTIKMPRVKREAVAYAVVNGKVVGHTSASRPKTAAHKEHAPAK